MKTKKHGKHGKHKKHKKEKREKKKRSSKSDSGSEEMEWVEAPAPASSTKEQREDWMQDESFVPTYDKGGSETKRRKQEKAQETMLKNKEILEQRELNPYMRSTKAGFPVNSSQVMSRQAPVHSVGDGGYSWLKKGYKRVKEQAEEEGRSMEEVARERWGSLERLEGMLKEAEARSVGTQQLHTQEDQWSQNRSENGRNAESFCNSKGQHYPSTSGYNRKQQYSSRNEYDEKHDMHTEERSYQKRSTEKHHSSGRSQNFRDKELNKEDDRWFKRYRETEDYIPNRSRSSVDNVRDKRSSKCYNEDKVYKGFSEQAEVSNRSLQSSKHERTDFRSSDSAPRKRFLAPSDIDNNRQSRPSHSEHMSSRRPAWRKENAVKGLTLEHRFMQEKDTHTHKSTYRGDDARGRSEDSVQPAVKETKHYEGAPSNSQENAYSSSEDTEKSSDDSENQEEIVLNQNELNYIAARSIQANIWKDYDLEARIEEDLKAAKRYRMEFEKSGGKVYDGEVREEVLRKKVERYPLPRALRSHHHKETRRSGRNVYVGPLKTKYFDDKKMSLQHIFEREKLTTADDQLKMFVDAASSHTFTADEECDEDVSGKTAEKMNKYPSKEKDAQKAIQDYKRLGFALDRCRFCLDKPGLLRHTIIAKSSAVFLCSPPYKSLVEGHCFIVPVTHASSTLLLDENEYCEVQAFKRGLMKMFGDKGKGMVFMETSVNHRLFPHAVIECIPMPKESWDLAPLYFKKAIEESEYEWSQNKKLIDLSKKGIRYSVPKGLPFFSVEFGNTGGFAHIVEDEKNFPRYFGKEIIGGMLEIDSHYIVREKYDSTKEICSKVVKLVNVYWKYRDYFKC